LRPADSPTTTLLKTFWQTLDRIGTEGAPRRTWIAELGEDFPKFEPLLTACGIVESILDPDFPGRILDLEERSDGDFDALSREIPSHRAPHRVPRAEVIRLVPNIPAISVGLAQSLGFIGHRTPPARRGNFHELGVLNLPRTQPRPVFLFLPSRRPRALALNEGLLGIESAVVLLPAASGMNFELRQIASARDIEIRILDTDKELSLAPALRGKKKRPDRPPLLTPRPGWEWKHLTLTFEPDGLRARIQGTERFASWKELGIRPLNRGKLQGPLQILAPLGAGGRISQSRKNETERQQISRARKLLQQLLPLPGDPFHKFKDGYGIVFTVEIPEARKRARARDASEEGAEDELLERTNRLDQGDLDGFSIHSF
jgi:hypothetical protein